MDPTFDTKLAVPFFKNVQPDLGFLYIPFAALVIAGASNAVNLTDGLDGLAIGPVMICGATYLCSRMWEADIEARSLLAGCLRAGRGRTCGGLWRNAGRGMGFLWYNAYPAEVFMGDVGSLSLGAAGCGSRRNQARDPSGHSRRRLRDRSRFGDTSGGFFQDHGKTGLQYMAPIHHHFELKGWAEPKVIVEILDYS